MANVMLKYLKFVQILNRRLSFSSVKFYPGLHLSRSYTNSKVGKSYATAAYKLAINEDSSIRNNDVISRVDKKDMSIDEEIARIDSLIRRNGRTQIKNINKIFSSLTNKEATSSTHALYLLRACKYCIDVPSSNRTKMVNEIWNRYQDLGIEFDVRHYNAMLDVHVKNRLDFNPVDILASMEDMKIEPNKDTYMLIMKKYCQDGNISGASEMLEYMKEKKMTADEKVFNYLIEAHINNNDIAGAKEMVEVMRSSNLEPTAETHAALACGYALSGNKEEMMSHLKECRGAENIHNILKVVETLSSSGNQQHVDEVLSLIEHEHWYQQEFINAAVELIHKGCIETAYKLAMASITPNYNEGINIFVKQLVKVGKDPSEILRYCEKIRSEGLSPNIYMVAARAYADCGNLNNTVQIFKRMEELGYYIRPSTFWPLFSSVKQQKKPSEGVWSILKTMSDYAVPCDFKTYTDIIYPILGVPKPDEVLNGIKRSGQAVDTAADALFVYYCNIGELDYALELTEKMPISISNKFDYENFVRLYQDINAESTTKYYKILKHIFTEQPDAIRCDVYGQLLAEIILHKTRLLEILLDKFEDMTFSEHTLYICEQELSARNPSRLAILRKIKTFNAERENFSKQENLSVEDENKYLQHLKAENISCRSFLLKRILHHIRTKNIVRMQELFSIFDEMKYEYTPLMLANLFGLYCTATDIDKAKESLNKLKTNFPDFQVDLPKALDFVALLIKYEKLDESYEALKDFLSKPHISHSRDVLFRSIKRLNTVLSNSPNVEFVRKMQDLLLVLSKEMGSKKNLLDSSVNFHILRGDLKSALEEFRNSVKTHHVPACLNVFLKKCINANEKDILQQVIDLTISCAGKSYALLELAVAFIESYKTQNAEKVIRSLGHETDPTILDNICAKLMQQNKLNELETLINITQSLNHVDRESLYCHLFKTCANRNDFERVLQLFEKLKAEVIDPRPETIGLLQNLFERNNQPIPLSLVSKSSSEISSSAAEATKNFLEQLEAGNSEAALKELSSLKKGYIRTLSVKTLTDLMDLCLQKNCTHELSLNVYAMSYIFDNVKEVLRPLLEKYSQAGDTEKFNQLLKIMPDFSLMGSGFNAYFCKAFINSGKYDILLSHLEERAAQKHKLFSGLAFEELLKLPEYEERVFNLAVKYYDANFSLPMSVVWAYYFYKGNYEKANEIYKKYPINLERIDNIILKHIKQDENVDLAKKYIDFVKEASVRARVKERAYGAAADLLVFKGMYDEATALVVDAEKQNLALHKYYLSTLVTLKSTLEKENKPVPFSIPVDTVAGTDSDSD